MVFKIAKVLMAAVVTCLLVFFLGPRATFDSYDNTPLNTSFDFASIDQMISDKESIIKNMKADNEARIVWADSIPSMTEFSIVYLHGFTASQGEGFPMHLNIADSLHANLYLPRLPEHGIDDLDAMKNLTPKMLVEEAKEAIAIAKSIGEKVIVMSCSTGGTLGIYLAAGDKELASLIMLSPNIAIVPGSGASMLTGPWGRQLAYKLIGEHRILNSQSNKQYWTWKHHTNGLLALQSQIDETMTADIFANLNLPIYCGYFYKNAEVQDPVVSVAAMLDFQKIISTPKDDVEFEPFEKGNHVLGSIYKNDNWKKVQHEVLDFIKREVL